VRAKRQSILVNLSKKSSLIFVIACGYELGESSLYVIYGRRREFLGVGDVEILSKGS